MAIESDIVGYSSSSLQEGATMVVPQFAEIGSTTGYSLNGFKANGEECSDNVVVSTLDSLGIKTASYIWINYGGESGEDEMWVDGETYEAPETAVVFAPGQALWVEALNDSQSVQSSGKVSTDDVTVGLCSGATQAGNPTPVSVDLQDLVCEGEECSDNVTISTLDALGIKTATYIWINYGGESGEDEMWVDGESYEAPETDVKFAPGQGLWIEGTSEDQSVTFPAVEL